MARTQQTASKVNGKNVSSVDKLIAARNEMRARKEKEAQATVKAKPTATRKPRAKATLVEEPKTPESMYAMLMSNLDEYIASFKIPSWKRALCAFLVGVAAAAGIGWLIGTVIGYAMIGAFAMTGSMTIVWLLYGFGLLLAAYAGLKITQKVGGYIISGDIDRDLGNAWGWVKGKFTSQPKLAAA